MQNLNKKSKIKALETDQPYGFFQQTVSKGLQYQIKVPSLYNGRLFHCYMLDESMPF